MQTPVHSIRLHLYLLGTPHLEHDGKLVEPDTRKAVALLAYLALTGQPHSRDALAALFYPDNDQSHARGGLRRTLSALAKVMEGAGLEISREQVGLAAGPELWTDAAEFLRLAAGVRAHPHQTAGCPECLAALERAAALYRGDFMAGFSLRDSPAFDDWQFFQAESLRREAAGVLEGLAQQYALANQWDPAITAARRWSALDPLAEDAHRELMRLYALSGQRNAALRQYQECARVLDKELGVEPLEETQQLHQDILENHLRRAAAATPAASPAASLASLNLRTEVKNLSFPLVGRGPETAALLRAYREQAPQGYWLALQGEAGVGKTRLAEDFLAYAQSQGASVLITRCYEGETKLAFAPFTDALRAALREPAMAERLNALPRQWLDNAARLLPELSQPGSERLSISQLQGSAGQAVFYESLRQVALAVLGANKRSVSNPAVLFIDDLHWADEASLDFLAYLVRRLARQPVLVLLAWRDEELPAAGRLRQLLAEASRQKQATSLHLERLSAAHVAELARLAAERSAYWQALQAAGKLPGLSERLYRETEGLPFFLVAYLEAALGGAGGENGPAAEDPLRSTPEKWDEQGQAEAPWPLPGSAQDLLRVRLAALDELSRQVLDAAAIIGRSFDFNTLLATAGRSEMETVTALETLLGRGLIRECSTCDAPAPVQYDFSHDKLRSLVYSELSQTRRRLLHRRVAEALVEASQRRRDTGPWAGQVTQHYHLAGMDAQAAPYDLLAGEYARRLYANREAAAYLGAALAYYRPQAAAPAARLDRRRLGWIYETSGDLHTLLGDYAAALSHYTSAIQQAESGGTESFSPLAVTHSDQDDPAALRIGFPQPDPVTRARLEHKLGAVHQRRGELPQAVSYFQNALGHLRSQPAGDQPGESVEGSAASDGSGGHPMDIPPRNAGMAACILADWSLAAHQAKDSQTGLDLAQQALALATVSQHPPALAQTHNLLGILARRMGQPEQACTHLLESLEAARQIDDPSTQAAALNNLALASSDLDDLPAAIGYSQQALSLCERLGDRHRAAALHNTLADLFHQVGDQAQSMQHLKQAVMVFSEIGGQAGDLQPEIWKLTEW